VNQVASKIIKLVIIMISLFSFKGNSQTNKPIVNDTMETLVASGEDASGGTGSVTYSIGQVFYTYMSESVYNVSQGIQQGELSNNTLTNDEDSIVPKIEVYMYPNPTTDYVTINMQGYQAEGSQLSYQIYDLQGRLLKQNAAVQSETQINVTDLRASIYLLKVYNNNTILKTFKIVKN
jgi:hypothetical protein